MQWWECTIYNGTLESLIDQINIESLENYFQLWLHFLSNLIISTTGEYIGIIWIKPWKTTIFSTSDKGFKDTDVERACISIFLRRVN